LVEESTQPEDLMEYIYVVLLLHKAGQIIDEESVKKVIEAASLKADDTKINTLVTALKSINIEEAVSIEETLQAIDELIRAFSTKEKDKR
jgi:ribosomal protein L12E/L44/L45/RPP1/RPP2